MCKSVTCIDSKQRKMLCYTLNLTDVESELSNELFEGSFKRLCVRVNSERTELFRLSDDMEYQVFLTDLGFLWR